jgi:hypothetical protein
LVENFCVRRDNVLYEWSVSRQKNDYSRPMRSAFRRNNTSVQALSLQYLFLK